MFETSEGYVVADAARYVDRYREDVARTKSENNEELLTII